MLIKLIDIYHVANKCIITMLYANKNTNENKTKFLNYAECKCML